MTELPNTTVQTSFQKLGKSMNDYAISFWITAGGSMILFFLYYFIAIFTIPRWEYGFPPIFLFIGILVLLLFLGLLIYNFVRFIQYLVQLNKTSQISQDSNLKKTYSLQLWSFILTISLVCIAVLFIGYIISVDYDPMYNFPNHDFEIILVLFVLFAILCGLIILILNIIAMFSFGQWAESLRGQNYQSFLINNIIDGSNLMKWGRLGTVFSATIGTLIFYIGMMKVGKNMMIYFGEQYIPENTNFNTGYSYQQSQAYYNRSFVNPRQKSSNSLQNVSNPNQQTHISVNQTQNIMYCPVCGTKQKNLNSKFCTHCGNRLDR